MSASPSPVTTISSPLKVAAESSAIESTPAKTVGPSAIAPTRASERIVEVDIVRAIALIGIVIVNFQSPNLTGAGLAGSGTTDRFADEIVQVFFNGKFYPLFSLLFGFGMSIQMMRARASGAAFVALYLRRLVVLFAIGVMHAVLVWQGDILHVYAFWGLLLLACHKLPNRWLLGLALGLIGFWALRRPFLEMLPLTLAASGAAESNPFALAASYPQLVAHLAQKLAATSLQPGTYLSQLDIPGMFLLGLYAGRRGVVDCQFQRAFLRRVMAGSLAIGVLGLVWTHGLWRMARIAGNENSLGSVIGALSSPFVRRTATIYYAQAIAIFYCCALLVLLGNARLKARLQPLAKLGRMALTNYLMHCAIAAVIFFGFGAYGKVGPATAILLALVVYAIQIPLSAWWLNRYRFGPVEWIWRSLTYGRVQPMKAA